MIHFVLSSTRPSSSTKQRNKRYKSSNKIYLTTRAATLLARDRTKHQYPTIIPETLIRYPCARDRISASSPQGTRYIARRRIESGRKCRERAIADPEGPVARTGAERTCSQLETNGLVHNRERHKAAWAEVEVERRSGRSKGRENGRGWNRRGRGRGVYLPLLIRA